MQFGSLKVFCDVARHRSFSQAAQANAITQSAASQIVSQLEKRMNTQLIDRSTRPLQLTSLGQAFYEGCNVLLEKYLELEEEIRTAHAEIQGVVQVAAIYSVGLGDMGQYVQRFSELQPKAQIHIDYLHPDDVIQRVNEGSADLGLVSFPRKSPSLTVIPWREEEMVFVCPSGHELADQEKISLKDLRGQKFVHFDKNLVIRRRIDRFLRAKGVTVDVAVEFDNIENIIKAVSIGAGVSILPQPTVAWEVKNGSLIAIPLNGCRLARPLGIIHRRHRLNPAVRAFLELLQSPLQSHSPVPEVATFAGGTLPNGSIPLRDSKHRNGPTRVSKRIGT